MGVLGHVGLIKWSDNPAIYEPCLGVVDSRVKSRGLFGKLFQRTMEIASDIAMQYCFFDFVTNHEYSQKFVSRYHPVDLAIFVGCQDAATQAKLESLGIGRDPKESDRYSLLYSIIPRVHQPFGAEIELPMNVGELLGFLLKPLNLSWYPASRFELLAEEGRHETHLQPAQGAVSFDLAEPGRGAAERILAEWRQLLRNGYQHAGVEIPLGHQGLTNLCDIFCDEGFFVSGFVPYRLRGDRLALRLQAMGPTKVSFDEIRVYSDTAKQLLDIIRQSYERNGFL